MASASYGNLGYASQVPAPKGELRGLLTPSRHRPESPHFRPRDAPATPSLAYLRAVTDASAGSKYERLYSPSRLPETPSRANVDSSVGRVLSPAALANSLRDAHHRDPKPHVDRTVDAVGRMSGGRAAADANDLGRVGGGRDTPNRGVAGLKEPAVAPPFDPVYSAAWHAYLGLADVPVPSSGTPAAPPPEHRGMLSPQPQPRDAQSPAQAVRPGQTPSRASAAAPYAPPSYRPSSASSQSTGPADWGRTAAVPPSYRPSSASSYSTAPADWERAAAAPPLPSSPVAAATVAAAETWRRSAPLSASLPAAPLLARDYGGDGSGMTPRLASPSLAPPPRHSQSLLQQQPPRAGASEAPPVPASTAISEPFPLPLHRSRPAYTAAALADAAGASAVAAYSPAAPGSGAATAAAGPAAAAAEWEALLEDLRGLRRGGARETWLHMTAESLRGVRDAYRRAYSSFAADCASPALLGSPHPHPWSDEPGGVAVGSTGDRRGSGLLHESPLELAAAPSPARDNIGQFRPAPPVSPEALDAAQRRLLETERARSRALAAQLLAGKVEGAGSSSRLALLPHSTVSPAEAPAPWQREGARSAAPLSQHQQQWGGAAAPAAPAAAPPPPSASAAAAEVVDEWLAELRRQRFAELDERSQRQRELMQREQGREAWPQRVPLQQFSAAGGAGTSPQHPSSGQQGLRQRPLVPPAGAPPADIPRDVSTANRSALSSLASQPPPSVTAESESPLPVTWGNDGYGRLLSEIHAQARADEATAAAVLSVLQPAPSESMLPLAGRPSQAAAAARPGRGQALTVAGATGSAAAHSSASDSDATGSASASGHWKRYVEAL